MTLMTTTTMTTMGNEVDVDGDGVTGNEVDIDGDGATGDDDDYDKTMAMSSSMPI